MSEGGDSSGLSFEGVLRRLSEPDTPPDARLVRMLSAPSAAEVAMWAAVWPGIAAGRRRWIAKSLRDTAESSFEVDYRGLFRVLLDDSDPEIRALAVDGLWEAQDTGLATQFARLLTDDADERVRARAAAALGRFVLAGELDELDPDVAARTIGMLVDAATDESEAIEVRRRATESAGYADAPEVRRVILDGLESGNESLQAGALRAIGNSADETWGPVVLGGLGASRPQLRFEAARAAGELMLADAVPALIELAQDDDREVQYEAVWALGEIGGRAAGSALERIAERTSDSDLLAAVEDALAMVALDDGAARLPDMEAEGAPLDDDEWSDDSDLDGWFPNEDEGGL